MKSLYLDAHTKEQALDYADREAEIHGFPRGGQEWKKAFKEHIEFAIGTMSTGRNPRNFRYKVFTSLYPEVFRDSGFAGMAAKKYRNRDGSVGTTLQAMEGRILSSIMNLAGLAENVVMEIRTKAIRKEGKIDNKDMSELQMPNREEYASKEEFEGAVKDVLYNWMVRDVIADCIVESLMPFWKLKKSDVEEIMAGVNLKDANVQEVIKTGREELIRHLRSAVGMKYSLPYKKAVLE